MSALRVGSNQHVQAACSWLYCVTRATWRSNDTFMTIGNATKSAQTVQWKWRPTACTATKSTTRCAQLHHHYQRNRIFAPAKMDSTLVHYTLAHSQFPYPPHTLTQHPDLIHPDLPCELASSVAWKASARSGTRLEFTTPSFAAHLFRMSVRSMSSRTTGFETEWIVCLREL